MFVQFWAKRRKVYYMTAGNVVSHDPFCGKRAAALLSGTYFLPRIWVKLPRLCTWFTFDALPFLQTHELSIRMDRVCSDRHRFNLDRFHRASKTACVGG